MVGSTQYSRDEIAVRIEQLGPWFHNMNLGGVWTAPNHFLGDYPAFKFRNFAHALPNDLRGKTVLDIGCNAGFYSMEMKRRGADRVLGIDFDDEYLNQARFAAEVTGMDIEFRKMSVYQVADLRERFDVVIFMGVLYHLRHPLLALDLLHQYVTRDLLIFQSLLRGDPATPHIGEDYPFSEVDVFEQPGYPRMVFVENRYSCDPTNWWLPNRACAEAMLRSSGYDILEHPEEEVFICRHDAAGGHPLD
jgi:tRNA (mo5U34)-methyltransferase